MTAPETTLDSFHRDRFWLVQPKLSGHRAGTDAMLLAACIPNGFSGRVADLGAGAGAAGLAVLSRCEDAQADLVEISALMADCARQTLALAQNARIGARATVIETDLTLTGKAREAAGLPSDAYDAVIANPPFNDARDRRTPDDLKALAHVMDAPLLENWVRTASGILKSGGRLAFIIRPEKLGEVVGLVEGRFGGVGVRGIHPRPGKPAIRILVTGIKNSRARLRLLPPLFMHGEGDAPTREADDLTNGRAFFEDAF